MQAGGVRRVDLAFEDLRPIAAHPDLGGADARIRHRRESGCLEFAHLLGRAHVGPYEPAGLARWVGLVPDALGNEAVGGFGRHLDHIAVHVEFPAVIKAAQAAFLVAREDQRCAPVRAVLVEHADAPLAVAEHHEILAEQAHLDRCAIRFGHFLGQARRDPVAAHDLAHRRVAFDAAQQIVFLRRHHGGILPRRTPRSQISLARPFLDI
jgi:hypothetical protein